MNHVLRWYRSDSDETTQTEMEHLEYRDEQTIFTIYKGSA